MDTLEFLLRGPKARRAAVLFTLPYSQATLQNLESLERLKRIWVGMLGRCYDPTHANYRRYGKRGIQVSPSWLNFATFYKDMAAEYELGLSIDRVNNDGDYCKENCLWMDPTDNLIKGNAPYRPADPNRLLMELENL